MDLKWNVYRYNFNTKKIELFNVFQHGRFLESLKKLLKKYKNKSDFSEQLKKELMYYFWCKYEYEIIISSFPYKENSEIKVDIYSQIMNNYNLFVDYIWNKKEKK